MKTKTTELDVDFIGGEGALTEEEEKSLHEFFSKQKPELQPSLNKIINRTSKKRVIKA
ncbi:MAG: hypothetical protein WCH34_14155 [Bacteroidota bacterium]